MAQDRSQNGRDRGERGRAPLGISAHRGRNASVRSNRERPSIDSSRRSARAAGLRPVRPADRRTLIRRVTFDLIGLPPTPEEVAEFETDASPLAYRARGRPPAGLAALRRALGPALDGRRSLCRHRRRQRRLSGPGGRAAIATISSTRSTATSRSTSSSASNWPATSWPGRALRASYAESVVATGFLALSRRYATAPVRALAPDARRHDRHDRPGLPRPDAPLRPLPRPQVRPGQPARLLRALRHLRQHDLSLCRLRGIAIEGVSAA